MRPLPDSDAACLSEAALLACAFIGGSPTYLDTNLQILRQYAETAEYDLDATAEDPTRAASDMSARIRHLHDDAVVQEGWAEVRSDGSGRLHHAAPTDAARWRTVDVDLAKTPARDRLLMLARHANRIQDPDARTSALLEFVHNAVAITAPDSLPPIRRGLLAITKELRLGRLAQPGMDPLDLVRAQEEQLMRVMWEERDQGLVDGATVADFMIAVLLAGAIAHHGGPQRGPMLWATYLMQADTKIVAAQPIEPVIERAVRDGFAEMVEALAAGLLASGEQQRTAAIDLETFDRGSYAMLLYDGYPYLHAARALAGCLTRDSRTAGPVQARIFRVADELAVDLPYLQPPGEPRFDPATLAVVVGLWLLRNVADGIAEALTAQSKAGTQAVLQRIGTAVTRHVRRDIPRAMDSDSDDAALDDAAAAAAASWTATHSILARVAEPAVVDFATTASDSVSTALIEAGLPAAAADRVCAALRIELQRQLNDG